MTLDTHSLHLDLRFLCLPFKNLARTKPFCRVENHVKTWRNMIPYGSTLPAENGKKVKLRKREKQKERDVNFWPNWLVPFVVWLHHSVTSSYRSLLGTTGPSCQGQRREACEQTSGLAEAVAASFVQILKQSRPCGVQNHNSSSCQNCLLEPTWVAGRGWRRLFRDPGRELHHTEITACHPSSPSAWLLWWVGAGWAPRGECLDVRLLARKQDSKHCSFLKWNKARQGNSSMCICVCMCVQDLSPES